MWLLLPVSWLNRPTGQSLLCPPVQEFEDQPCLVCGSAGHQQWACPNKATSEVYKLPDQMQGAVNDLYQRDIARVHVSARLLGFLVRIHEFRQD